MGTAVVIRILIGFLVFALHSPVPGRAAQDDAPQSEEGLFYEVASLNEGLPPLEPPPDLTTPRAALVNMIRASHDGDFERGARSLNFQAIPAQQRAPATLAKHFYYVITQRVQVDLKKVPDRPNGAFDDASNGSDSPAPFDRPRRSLKIGEVPLALGTVEIRLERFKPSKGEPVWLFSPRTVEKIADMYAFHGPGPLFNYLPFQARQGLLTDSSAWQWLVLMALAGLSTAAGWIGTLLIRVPLPRLTTGKVLVAAARMAAPLGLLIGLLTFHGMTYRLLAPPGTVVHGLYVLLSMLFVAALTWMGVRLIEVVSALATRRYHDQAGALEEEEARVRFTRIAVGRYLLIFLAMCLGLGLTFYQLHVINNLSLSFLASAGVASVLLGATAHTVLGNMLAGLQIALTRPVSIGDSITFEGHWGCVEEITYGYVAIHTWDDRRVIVPLNYFISHPFENWSKSGTRIIKPIFLYADYHVDVDAMRKTFRDLLDRSDKWDRSFEPVFQVTGMSEKTVELRALCSAKDAGAAWDLHCELREGLVAFLQRWEGGRYLPKQRLELSGQGGDQSPPAPGA